MVSPLLPGGLHDHRCRPGAGAAPKPGGDEDHIASLDRPLDLVLVLESRLLAHLRDRTSTKTAGSLPPDEDPCLRDRPDEVLGIGIESDQPCPVDPFLHHPGDSVRSPSPAPDDCYLGPELHKDLFKLLIDLNGLREALFLPRP